MLKSILAVSAILSAALAGGCAGTSGASSSGGAAGVAGGGKAPRCRPAPGPGCEHNVDLACVDVEVEKDTPSYTYNGKVYYFCSDSCLKKFQKDPAKYLDQK